MTVYLVREVWIRTNDLASASRVSGGFGGKPWTDGGAEGKKIHTHFFFFLSFKKTKQIELRS